MIQITCEDNMILMKRYPDKYFDIAFIDPPYGISAPKMSMGSGYDGGERITKKLINRLSHGGETSKFKNSALKLNSDWDFEPPQQEFWNELFRVSKQQIIFGGNYFPLPPARGIAIWDKKQAWENFSQFELIWASYDKPAHIFTLCNAGGANPEKKIHPTQKPVLLLKKILHWYGATPGMKILDTGTGSGSIGIACLDMELDLVGCEKDEVFYTASMKRIAYHQKQQKLFNLGDIQNGQNTIN